MKYRFQVRLAKGTDKERWADVRPSGGAPYEFATYAEAEAAAYLCYGRMEGHRLTRVVEIEPAD